MAINRMIRRAGVLGLTLILAACGTGQQGALTELAGELRGRLGSGASTQMTATRAELIDLGITQSLIVISLPEAGTRGGLLKSMDKNGVTIWAAADGGSTVTLQGGVLRNTTGFGYDLYSSDTRAARRAISTGESDFYPRVFRHLDGEGNLRVSEFACRMDAEGHESITVFQRAHATVRFQEICAAQANDATGEKKQIVNTYWRDKNGTTIWRAQQWISPELGQMTLERVFK